MNESSKKRRKTASLSVPIKSENVDTNDELIPITQYRELHKVLVQNRGELKEIKQLNRKLEVELSIAHKQAKKKIEASVQPSIVHDESEDKNKQEMRAELVRANESIKRPETALEETTERAKKVLSIMSNSNPNIGGSQKQLTTTATATATATAEIVTNVSNKELETELATTKEKLNKAMERVKNVESRLAIADEANNGKSSSRLTSAVATEALAEMSADLIATNDSNKMLEVKLEATKQKLEEAIKRAKKAESLETSLNYKTNVISESKNKKFDTDLAAAINRANKAEALVIQNNESIMDLEIKLGVAIERAEDAEALTKAYNNKKGEGGKVSNEKLEVELSATKQRLEEVIKRSKKAESSDTSSTLVAAINRATEAEKLVVQNNKYTRDLEIKLVAATERAEDAEALTKSYNDNKKGEKDDTEEEESSDDEESVVGSKDEWTTKFNELREYRIIYGDCKVKYSKDLHNPKYHLSRWVRNQRTKKKKMEPKKIAKLDHLGFWWGKDQPSSPSWDYYFQELFAFHKKTGHCDILFDRKYPTPLATWTSTQRTEYKRFKKARFSLISLDQIQELKNIGFVWKGPKF